MWNSFKTLKIHTGGDNKLRIQVAELHVVANLYYYVQFIHQILTL
jgi:hypothetical protein